MTPAPACDGAGLVAALAGAAAHLRTHSAEIDALNVFPVPDGDTGSNMYATVSAALDEARAVPPSARTLAAVAGAVRFGALMGARGNSGVILSQVFGGMAEAVEAAGRMDARTLADALERGSRKASAAVARPVEGTILTVAREAARGARDAARGGADIATVLAAAVVAAERAVADTPRLLPVLRDAGVVDAGGQGLLRLLEGGRRALRGEIADVDAGSRSEPSPAAPAGGGDGGFGYETMYLLIAGSRPLDVDAIRAELEAVGDSVLAAGDERAVKIHVHSVRPDVVIGIGLAHGRLTRVTIEDLDTQASDVREARAEAFARDGGDPGASRAGAPAARVVDDVAARVANRAQALEIGGPDRGSGTSEPRDAVSVVAVAPGDGLARILEGLGAAVVVRGGQTQNPSAGELADAVRRSTARCVIVLPNNANAWLAAEQSAALSTDREVSVVPTRNAAEGIAAVLAFDERSDVPANVERMEAAARFIRTLQVTQAVRDARVGGLDVRAGETMVLDPDDGLVTADADPIRATLDGLGRIGGGFELVTVYHGADVGEDEVARLGDGIGAAFPGVEVEIIDGGQRHPSYLISAE